MTKVEFSMPSITSKVFPGKKEKTPVFNRPFGDLCPHYRISRIVYLVALSSLILISIPVIALKAMTYSFIEDNRSMGFVFQTEGKDGEEGVSLVMAALPKNLHHAPAKLVLVAAVISIFLGAAHLGFVAVDWKTGKKTQAWAFRRNIMFIHVLNSLLCLFALVAIYATNKQTSHFFDNYVNFRAVGASDDPSDNSEDFFRYNIGTFDLETWSCELKDAPGATMARDDYGRQCAIETAGRAIMIPFVILAWSVAFIGLWGLVVGGRRGPDGERVKTVDVGLEMGKMNATDSDP